MQIIIAKIIRLLLTVAISNVNCGFKTSSTLYVLKFGAKRVGLVFCMYVHLFY